MKLIKWTKWRWEGSGGSMPSLIRNGLTKTGVPVEISGSRADVNSQLWHIAIRINDKIVQQQGLVRYETQRDMQVDLRETVEGMVESAVDLGHSLLRPTVLRTMTKRERVQAARIPPVKNTDAKTHVSRVQKPVRSDGLRSRTGRGSPPTVAKGSVRSLHTKALTAIGIDCKTAEQAPLPDLAFHFCLVGHGYELHLFDKGKLAGSVCRDFDGNHTLAEVKESLLFTIGDAVAKWRSLL